MWSQVRSTCGPTCDDDSNEKRLGYQARVELMEEKCWQKYQDCEAPDFFEVLEFAEDGGFSEVHELWNVMRYLGALVAIGMMLSNLFTIVINDSHYLISSTHITSNSTDPNRHDSDSYVRIAHRDSESTYHLSQRFGVDPADVVGVEDHA
eukprot:Skav230479  [mRNA]  locus=scaffold1445:184605:193940:- [translate_table: standard]